MPLVLSLLLLAVVVILVLLRTKPGSLYALIGTPLQRVRDTRLAATILMIQLVRTGSPVTASEKTKILELMDDPLSIKDASAMFEQAWTYTEPRVFFSTYADQLLPLLRTKLAPLERRQLVGMLTEVANSYGEVSELQEGAINRLDKHLMVL